MTTATTPEAVRKPAATINDLTPRTDPKGGILVAMLLPAVQKCR